MPEARFVILLYHGVSEAKHRGIENCSGKHVPAWEFARDMEHLAKNYTVLPLSTLLESRQNLTLPPRAVAVTFDDGFENNYTVAFPVLQKYDIPATFYLSTGFIGARRIFWVDKIEYLLNESPLECLRLETLGKTYSLRTLSDRVGALREIKHSLKTVPGRVEETLAELEQACRVQTRYDYLDYRTLTWDQVREMRRSGLCDFGAHTVDHAILSHLSREEKIYQIEASKRQLEAELREPVSLFSYTEGLQHHYDAETVDLLQRAGFSSAPTAIYGVNTATTSEYHLHRNMVGMTASFRDCVEVLFDHCC